MLAISHNDSICSTRIVFTPFGMRKWQHGNHNYSVEMLLETIAFEIKQGHVGR